MLNEDEEAEEEERGGGGNLAYSFMDKTTLSVGTLSSRKRKWHQLNKAINLPWVLALFLPIQIANLL
jgi:hypothetical protein